MVLVVQGISEVNVMNKVKLGWIRLNRKEYLISKLFSLDEIYLNKPLYDFSLPELEIMHIKELNKTEHINRWRVGYEIQSLDPKRN